MDPTKPVQLLKIYLGETEKYQGKSLYMHLVHQFHRLGLAGVTVYRGIVGFGQDHRLHLANILELSADLPIIIEVVDNKEKIQGILPLVRELVPRGLVFTVDVELVKYGK